MELSSEGERGIAVPEVEPEVAAAAGDPLAGIPPALRRAEPPALPELSQPQVLRHFLRLSQETLGEAVNVALGLGTCTMKHSPRVNEELIRSPKVADLHPLQDDDTVQGVLAILHALRAGALRDLRARPLQLPARRRLAGRLRQRPHDPRLPRGARRGRSATRS